MTSLYALPAPLALSRGIPGPLSGDLATLGPDFEAACREDKIALATGTDEESDAAYDKVSNLVDRILASPARNLAGLQVKARALLWCRSGSLDLGIEDSGTTDVKLIESIIYDLYEMIGVT